MKVKPIIVTMKNLELCDLLNKDSIMLFRPSISYSMNRSINPAKVADLQKLLPFISTVISIFQLSLTKMTRSQPLPPCD